MTVDQTNPFNVLDKDQVLQTYGFTPSEIDSVGNLQHPSTGVYIVK